MQKNCWLILAVILILKYNKHMPDISETLNILEQTIITRLSAIEAKELKELKKNFEALLSGFQTLRKRLIEKAIITENPYKYETSITKLGKPPETAFTETNKAEEMSNRLYLYEAYLDYVFNYFPFTSDALNFKNINELRHLVSYFDFIKLSTNSANINTRVLAEYLSVLLRSSNTILSELNNQILSILKNSSEKILAILQEIEFVQKERYKTFIKKIIYKNHSSGLEKLQLRKNEIIKETKAVIQSLNEPIIDAYITEAFDEIVNFKPDDFDKLIKKLKAENIEEKKKKDVNYRIILNDAINGLAGASFSLETIIEILKYNHAILITIHNSFFSKLIESIKQFLSRKSGEHIYELEFLDPLTNKIKIEPVNYDAFINELETIYKKLTALADNKSTLARKVKASSEEQVLGFLVKLIEALQVELRKIQAFDAFFLKEFENNNIKHKFKSALSAQNILKETLIKANQRRYEYIATKEEEEQLKKLGIK